MADFALNHLRTRGFLQIRNPQSAIRNIPEFVSPPLVKEQKRGTKPVPARRAG